MVEIKYKIQSYTNSNTIENIHHIQSQNRNLKFIYPGPCFNLTIEFETCILSEIQIGLLHDSKITISAMHKTQQLKKMLIEKSESVNTLMKAIVYKSDQFKNFNTSEISILIFSFKGKETQNCVGLAYITLLKQTNQNPLQLSPVEKIAQRPIYDFIDSKNPKLNVSSSMTSEFAKKLETGQTLVESEFKMDSQGVVKSDQLVRRMNNGGDRLKRENDVKVHTNSYAGAAIGTVIWLICGDELKNVMHEICDVLGILVLEQPSDIIDFIVCDHYNSTISNLAQLSEKPVLGCEWLLECLNTRSKAKTSEFLLN